MAASLVSHFLQGWALCQGIKVSFMQVFRNSLTLGVLEISCEMHKKLSLLRFYISVGGLLCIHMPHIWYISPFLQTLEGSFWWNLLHGASWPSVQSGSFKLVVSRIGALVGWVGGLLLIPLKSEEGLPLTSTGLGSVPVGSYFVNPSLPWAA